MWGIECDTSLSFILMTWKRLMARMLEKGFAEARSGNKKTLNNISSDIMKESESG